MLSVRPVVKDNIQKYEQYQKFYQKPPYTYICTYNYTIMDRDILIQYLDRISGQEIWTLTDDFTRYSTFIGQSFI